MTRREIYILSGLGTGLLIVAISFLASYDRFDFHAFDFHGGSSQAVAASSSAESASTEISTASSGLYTLSPAERNSMLYQMNEGGKYQIVVSATDDGIKNYNDLIWDDVDFWNHRGYALYNLGDCADAGAAFFHVLAREPQNAIASGLMADLKDCKEATSSSST